jgi:UDP-glucose 4-epimerase
VAVIGAGFIGTHVAAALLGANVETVVINRSPLEARKRRLLSGARVAVVDANAGALLRPHLEVVDHVVYCASGLMPAESNLDPIVDIGLSLPPLVQTLEQLRDLDGVGLTYLSSGGTVYGNARALSIDERHPTEPVTSYGIMKLAGEKYALMHHRLYGVPVRILRCSNVYGEHQPASRSQGVIAVFLERIAAGLPVPIYGDGTIVRDFVHVGDVVALLLRSIARPGGSDTINVGSGRGYSLAEVVTEIEAAVGRAAVVERLPDRGYDVPRVVLDISLARRELGFDPIPLAEGLRRTLAHAEGGAERG